MAEYINREELLKDINDSVRFSTRNGVSAEIRGAHKIVDRIYSAPTADVVEVVHGEWEIVDSDLDWVDGKCSACGYTDCFYESGFYKYCPDCGAKMDGERRSE
jgi:hypothetical protein